jgi:hypothetical protein
MPTLYHKRVKELKQMKNMDATRKSLRNEIQTKRVKERFVYLYLDLMA